MILPLDLWDLWYLMCNIKYVRLLTVDFSLTGATKQLAVFTICNFCKYCFVNLRNTCTRIEVNALMTLDRWLTKTQERNWRQARMERSVLEETPS